jgi:hypothetical protein
MSVENDKVAMPIVLAEERQHDPHPEGAYNQDGRKLALVNCQCPFCLHDHIRRLERKHPFY